jgi:Ca2+-transporting ATPase
LNVVKDQKGKELRLTADGQELSGTPEAFGEKWHAVEAADALETLGSSLQQGLTDDEARFRINLYGMNEIAEAKNTSSWKLLLSQFKETLILILIVAAVISFAVGEALDSAVILAIVLA